MTIKISSKPARLALLAWRAWAAKLAKDIFINTCDNSPLGTLASLREAISLRVSSKLANLILASLYIGIAKGRQVFYEKVKKRE